MMGALLAYSIAVSIFLIPLYLTIRLLMAGLTFHALTRWTMLCALVASLILPFAVEPLRELMAASHSATVVPAIEIEIPVATVIVDDSSPSTSPLLRIILVIYSLGLIYFIGREIIGIIRLTTILRRSRPISTCGRWTVAVSDEPGISPFSFGCFIIVSASDIPVPDTILIHESQHLRSRHWLDLILAEAAAILCWWNPAGWLIRRDLAVTHEYEADDAVLRAGCAADQYQIMLIKKAAGSRFPSIACSLSFHSNISKRIKMMLRKKSRPALRLAALAAIPAVAVSIVALSAPAVANVLSAVSDAKVTDFSVARQTEAPEIIPAALPVSESVQPIADDVTIPQHVAAPGVAAVTEAATPATDTPDNRVFEVPETNPVYPGGDAELFKYIATNIRYPEECVKNNIQGRSIVQFVVRPDCTVGDIRIVRSAGNELLDAEAMRVVKDLKFEKPGMVKGEPVAVWYTLPLMFKLSDDTPAPAASTAEQTPVYSVAEGDAGLYRFLAANLRYPEQCAKDNIQGTAIVRCVVETDGSVSSPEIIRSAGNELLDAEAVRVISLLKFEQPARNGGQPVRVNYTLPISFKLSFDSATESLPETDADETLVIGRGGN